MQTFGCAGFSTGAEGVDASTAAAVVFLFPLGFPNRPVNKHSLIVCAVFNTLQSRTNVVIPTH